MIPDYVLRGPKRLHLGKIFQETPRTFGDIRSNRKSNFENGIDQTWRPEITIRIHFPRLFSMLHTVCTIIHCSDVILSSKTFAKAIPWPHNQRELLVVYFSEARV